MSTPNLYPLKGGLPDGQLRSPYWQQGLMISLLQQYFGCADRIALESSTFLWNTDQKQSKVYINDRDNFDPAIVGKRPTIIVGIGAQTYPKQIVGDLMAIDKFTGDKQFQDVTEGTWEIECFGWLSGESVSLATEVKYFLSAYRHIIADKYSFKLIRVNSMSASQKKPEYQNEYVRTVTVGYTIEDNFTLSQMALKISALNLKLNSN